MEPHPWWRGNLPAEPNRFVGRQAEVTKALKLLADTSSVTITGAAGVGKTRIALRAAAECRDFHPDGAWLVELSGERDGGLLPHAVAAVMGMPERSARPQDDLLVEFLAGKHLLLILDSCDRLAAACRELAVRIRAEAPGVRLLLTSRRPLGLPHEAVLPVEPFRPPAPRTFAPRTPVPRSPEQRTPEPGTPDPWASAPYPADAATDDALRVFLDRAEAVAPGLVTGEAAIGAAERICRLLGGVPLALELAAGHLPAAPRPAGPLPTVPPPAGPLPAAPPSARSLPTLPSPAGSLPAGSPSAGSPAGPVEWLADRLEERFEPRPAAHPPFFRPQRLRAVIDWSHELCSPAERLLWARLSVFAGPIDPESARWVCGDERLNGVPELLAGLAAKGLLTPVPGGYRQPEPVREYGAERLARLGEEARTVRRHRHHHLGLARRAEAGWYGPAQEEWAARLRFSLPDLRRVLDSPSDPLSAELAGILWIIWHCMGRLNEGRRHLGRVIAAAPVADPGLPRLLWADACVAAAQGDPERAHRRAEAALSAALDWSDHAAAGYARLALACHALLTGALGEVRPAVRRVREHFHRAGVMTVGEPLALVVAAIADTWRGEFARAVTTLEEAGRQCEARGELWARAQCDHVLSIARLGLGEADEAARAAGRSLAARWRLRDTAGAAEALGQLAVIASIQGDARRTARLQGAEKRMRGLSGARGPGRESVCEPGTVAERTARQLLGDDAYDAAFAEGCDDDPGSAVLHALG
ncbi:ATP-binding protein [Streptosporangium sandarakinum]|uniref:ATP-binding protein n=1 Tax=Streptosporangium sandarakinum TaxID=1260955 RepID=UPI0036A2E573